jgi:hypothetical protein
MQASESMTMAYEEKPLHDSFYNSPPAAIAGRVTEEPSERVIIGN